MVVDARGLSCPQPVLMTKNALKKNDNIEVLVDNETAKENVSRYAVNNGYKAVVDETGDMEFSIKIGK